MPFLFVENLLFLIDRIFFLGYYSCTKEKNSEILKITSRYQRNEEERYLVFFFVLKIDNNIKNKGDGLKKYYLSQC